MNKGQKDMETLQYTIKVGDNFLESVRFDSYDEVNEVTTMPLPTRAVLHLVDADGVTVAEMDSDSGKSPDGTMTITQVGSGVQIGWNLPRTVTAGFAAGDVLTGDLVLIGATEIPDPWTACEVQLTLENDYTAETY